MLVGPNIQCRRRNLIYQWNSKAKSREVYAFDVMPARITGFDTDVVVFGGVKISEFCWPLFVTISASDAPERPINRAGCTYKASVTTLGSRLSDLKKTDLRHPTAEGALPFGGFKHSIEWVAA